MSEMKWLAIMTMGIFAALFTAMAVEKYTDNQCKIAYSTSTKTADEIRRLCGR